MIRKILLVIGYGIHFLLGYSQENKIKEELNFSQIMERIKNGVEQGESKVVINNKTIRVDYRGVDSVYVKIGPSGTSILKDQVTFNHENLVLKFSDCTFKNQLPHFQNCSLSELQFIRCNYQNGFLNISECDIDVLWLYRMNFGKEGANIFESSIKKITLSNSSGLFIRIKGNTITGQLMFDHNDLDGLFIERNHFGNENWEFNKSRHQISILDYEDALNELRIMDNSADSSDSGFFFYTTGSINRIYMGNNLFPNGDVNFNGTKIKGAFYYNNNLGIKKIGFDGFSFPELSSYIDWSSVEHDRISIGDIHSSMDSLYHLTEEYNKLIGAYNKIYKVYKYTGNRMSANDCYVEMKDIELGKFKYNYKVDKNLHTWFNWRLNQFLKIFCDYGTDPVKSLVFSMWVILLFSFLYFFTYSKWDHINRNMLMIKASNLLHYFQSEQNLEEYYSEEYKSQLSSYKAFREEVKSSKGKVPSIVNIIFKPLYGSSVIWHKVISWTYRRLEIIKGKYEDLSRSRKIYVASMVSISLFFYGLYLLVVRSMNALFLSVNTFTTLGFGEIPVKGMARYLAILEGFIGWFLLSIFSVSLISQILQ